MSLVTEYLSLEYHPHTWCYPNLVSLSNLISLEELNQLQNLKFCFLLSMKPNSYNLS